MGVGVQFPTFAPSANATAGAGDISIAGTYFHCRRLHLSEGVENQSILLSQFERRNHRNRGQRSNNDHADKSYAHLTAFS